MQQYMGLTYYLNIGSSKLYTADEYQGRDESVSRKHNPCELTLHYKKVFSCCFQTKESMSDASSTYALSPLLLNCGALN